MKWNSNLILLLIAAFITSCGKSIGEFSSAPKTQNQAGLIASCTTKSEAQEISKLFGAKFRVINEKSKLMEFVGIKREDLALALPKAKLKQNIVFERTLISGDFSAQYVSNTEFYGAHTPQYRNESSGRYFTHLDQINALDNPNKLGEGVVIAIVDTGVYYNHPHLSPNILTGTDKHGSAGNGSDDDGNGYKDDYVGWDFYNGDAYPIDDNGHGTHVAGLAASTYMGIAPKAKILPVKVLSSSGSGDIGTIAAGILYAIDKGADIVNLSLGGASGDTITSEVRALINSVRSAKSNGVLIVAAAGNGGSDGIGDCNDSAPIYPANIDESNVVSVAAVNLYNELTEYSNFGGESVHIAAPGGDLYTGGLLSTGIPDCYGPCTERDNSYRQSSGTSMATPVAAGLAAVLKSAKPSLSPEQIKTILMNSGEKISKLSGVVGSASVINVAGAIELLD